MKKAIATLFLVWAAVGASAAVVYETSFEAPTFAAGAVIGQDGWTGDDQDAAQIQASRAHTGTQSLAISASSLMFSTKWWERKTPFNPVAAGTPIVEVSTFLYWDDGGDSFNRSDEWGLQVYDSAEYRVAQFAAKANGEVYIYDCEDFVKINTGLTVQFNAWNELKVVMDYANDTYYGVVNGVKTASANLGMQDDFGDASFRLGSGYLDTCYFDDYSIVATPEPATLTLLMLCGALLRSRRGQQHTPTP